MTSKLRKIFLKHDYSDSKKRAMILCFAALFVSCICVVTIPFIAYAAYKKSRYDNDYPSERVIFFSSLVNTAIINALWSSLALFFLLRKGVEKGVISHLSTKDIALISFITFAVLAIAFSCIAGSVIYSVRKEMQYPARNKELIYEEAFLDTLFLNPIGLVSGALLTALGTIHDNCMIAD